MSKLTNEQKDKINAFKSENQRSALLLSKILLEINQESLRLGQINAYEETKKLARILIF